MSANPDAAPRPAYPMPGDPKPLSPRSHARSLVLQALYQVDMTKADPVEALAVALRSEEERVGKDTQAFARTLMDGVAKALPEIDIAIEKQSHHWRLDRMDRVDRNVLRLATYELMLCEAPRKVVLNEAIELAKRFGSAESGAFVNGILDKLAKKVPSLGGKRDEAGG